MANWFNPLQFFSKKVALQAASDGQITEGQNGLPLNPPVPLPVGTEIEVEGRAALVVQLPGNVRTIQFLGETHSVGTQRPADGRKFHRSAYGRSVEESS